MPWIAILIVFLATISIIFSLRLSERQKTSFPVFVSFVKSYQPLWPITLGLTISFSVLLSLYSAIGFLAGILIFIVASFVELIINNDKTNPALFNLFAASLSILSISLLRLVSLTTPTLISFFAGALLVAWYKKTEYDDSHILRNILIACVGVLGANYFYAGSENAAQFLLLLIALGCASMLVSIFAATNYGQSKPKQMFIVATIAYAVIAAATAAWIIPFRPINVTICIAVGLVATHVCLRFDKPWIKFGILAVTLLSSYFIAEFYGATAALISLSALTPNSSLLPNIKNHTVVISNYIFALLIPLFIHSVSTAGHSMLFEIGNPFLLSGILLSTLIIWGHETFMTHPIYTEKRSWVIMLLPIIIGVIGIILFKENSGILLLTGALIGLVLRVLLLSNYSSDIRPHKNLTLLFFVASFLFTNFLFS